MSSLGSYLLQFLLMLLLSLFLLFLCRCYTIAPIVAKRGNRDSISPCCSFAYFNSVSSTGSAARTCKIGTAAMRAYEMQHTTSAPNYESSETLYLGSLIELQQYRLLF